MKHRIQHPEYRIQKVGNAYGVEDVAGGTPTAATGTVAVPGNRRGAGQNVGFFGTGSMGKRVEVGKGGCEIGKWCSFSHFETALIRLFPHDSTQVVDFPCMYDVKLFSEGLKNGFQPQTGLGIKFARLREKLCELLRVVTGKVREVSRKSTKVRTDQARKSAMLRIVTGKTNFLRRRAGYNLLKETMKPGKRTKIELGCRTCVFLVARFGARELA